MQYSNFELVRGINAGDKSALDLLVRRWYPRIYGYSVKLIGNEQDAYDITQDVLIAMMQNLSQYHPWKRFDSWIFTIAHNKCMDYFRLQKHLVPMPEDMTERPDPSPPPDVLAELTIPVREALGRLSDKQREVVVYHYFYQLTAKEIAELTGAPLPTIKSRLVSAKKALLKDLREVFL